MAIRGIGDAGPGAGPHIKNEYAVKAGDTLESIAKNNGFAVDDLIKNNPQLGESPVLKAGMVLNLPAVAQSQATVEMPKDVLEIGGPPKTFLDRLKETPSPLMLQTKLSPEQFEVKPDGNLLIKNDQLSGFFRSIAGYNFINAWPSKVSIPALDGSSKEGLMYKVSPGDALTPKVESQALLDKSAPGDVMPKIEAEALTPKVEGELFLNKAAAGESLLNKAAGDLNFLSIDGVPGESKDDKHPTEISLAFDGRDALADKLKSESFAYKVAPQESLMIKGEIESVGENLMQKVREGADREIGEAEKSIKFTLPDLKEMSLTADQFEVDTDGNLLVKNFDLSQALQNLFTEPAKPEAQAVVIMASEKLKE